MRLLDLQEGETGKIISFDPSIEKNMNNVGICVGSVVSRGQHKSIKFRTASLTFGNLMEGKIEVKKV